MEQDLEESRNGYWGQPSLPSARGGRFLKLAQPISVTLPLAENQKVDSKEKKREKNREIHKGKVEDGREKRVKQQHRGRKEKGGKWTEAGLKEGGQHIHHSKPICYI